MPAKANPVIRGAACALRPSSSEEARGKGVGRALIEAVYDKARMAGSPCVYWRMQERNRTARELCDKFAQLSGFIVCQKPP